MTELFEVISEDEFVAEQAVGEDLGLVKSGAPPPQQDLTYCEFCKGYYNEYHFGEPEGGE
jgi:hypothetical protein